jgi:hypothetical protein
MAEVGRDAMIPVDFVLATESDHRYQGQLREIAPITEPTPAGTVLRAVVDLAPDALPPLRDGAAVTARISCGKRKAAFIWLREPIEVLQRNWWY